jgi:hypothetical protein
MWAHSRRIEVFLDRRSSAESNSVNFEVAWIELRSPSRTDDDGRILAQPPWTISNLSSVNVKNMKDDEINLD